MHALIYFFCCILISDADGLDEDENKGEILNAEKTKVSTNANPNEGI